MGPTVAAVCVILFTVGLTVAQGPTLPPADLSGVWSPVAEPAPPGGRPALPFTDEAQRKVAAYRTLVAATGDSPGGYCVGYGMTAAIMGTAGYPLEIHQRPQQILFIYELHNEVRRVYFGARVIPPADRRAHRSGHSSGRWDGDALVVDMTLTDPVFYLAPVQVQRKWTAVPDGHLLPYECAEEEWRKRLEQLERKAGGAR